MPWNKTGDTSLVLLKTSFCLVYFIHHQVFRRRSGIELTWRRPGCYFPVAQCGSEVIVIVKRGEDYSHMRTSRMQMVHVETWRHRRYVVIRGHRGGIISQARYSSKIGLAEYNKIYHKNSTLNPNLRKTSRSGWKVDEYSQTMKYDYKKKKVLDKPVKFNSQPKVQEYLRTLEPRERKVAGKARVQYYIHTTVKGKDVTGLSDSVLRRNYRAGRKQAYLRFLDALSYTLIGHTDQEYAEDWLDKHGWTHVDEGIKWYTPKSGRELKYYADRDWQSPLREDVYSVASQGTAEGDTDLRFRY